MLCHPTGRAGAAVDRAMAAVTPGAIAVTGAWRSRIALAVLGALLATAALRAAFPDPVGPVSDFADVLSAAEEQALVTLLDDVESATSAEIAVVTVPTLDGLSVEEYANRLFAAWGIGRKDLDNGVLVLVAPTEREMRIEVGYGLEGILPDGLAGQVIRTTFLPRFRDDDYAGGIVAGTARVADIVRRRHVLTAEERRRIDEDSLPPGVIMVPFLGVFVTIGFLGVGAGLRAKAVGAMLFGAFFGGVPLLMSVMATTRTGFATLCAIAVVMLGVGIHRGNRRAWREFMRGAGAAGRDDAWVVGSFSSVSSSGGGSGSSGGFGGGSSGGGGASGRW